jgi:hypothetical protein
MRADSKPQPPSHRTGQKKSRGRRKYYGDDALREIWLFFQEQAHRTKSSIHRISKTLKFEFSVLGRGGAQYKHRIGGETLRNYYYEAEAILAQERQMWAATPMGNMRWRGIGNPVEPTACPIARLWNAELQRRLAEPA